jgi:hypothetical protein
MALANWPRQDLPVSKKDDAWRRKHLDYAEQLLKNYSDSRARMTRLYESYNGVKTPLSLAWIERRYGKQNAAKYIAYRVGRTKLSLLHGEMLKRPLSSTVETINSDAISAKMKQMDVMIGAMLAKDELKKLKDIAGVDVMEGAPIPESEDDPIWKKMSPKDKEEDIMQIILDEQLIELDVKKKVADCFLDLLITSMCYCKLEVDQNGDVQLHRIDPRDAIFEEIQGDDYLEKSPIMGCRQTLSIQEILTRYDLTKDQRDKLDNARLNPSLYIGAQGISRGYMRQVSGQMVADVIHIEWDSVTPMYYKKSPKTKSQMEVDSGSDVYTLEMDARYYEDNIDMHSKNIAKGEYQIETRYRIVKYEATRIGGCIDVNMREKPYQVRSMDDPTQVMNSTYHGYICSTVDGVRISIQQMVENFDNMYDVNMYQINKDLARAKGKALFYDLAGLPEGKKMKDIMYQVLNDGIVSFNSAAAGNFAGKNLDLTNAIKEIDLGLSASLEYSLRLQDNILNQLNQITGINENREGQIAASSTATNANSAISASRTITEPIFFGMNGLVKRLLHSVVNVSALSWAFYKVEKGEQILGTDKFKYLQASKELGYKDYGVHIEDGSRYMEMRKDMKELMSISLNAKEIRPMDAYKVLLSETTAQMKAALETSWDQMQKAAAMSDQANNQVQQQIAAAKLQQQVDLANADREDRQLATLTEIDASADAQIRVDDNNAKNQFYHQQQKTESDIITKQ